MTGSYIRRTFSPILLKKIPDKIASFNLLAAIFKLVTWWSRYDNFVPSVHLFLPRYGERGPWVRCVTRYKMTARKRGQPELSASLAYSIQNEPRSTWSFRSCSIWINRFQLAVLVRFYMYSTWRKPFEVWCSMVENSWVAAVVFFGSLIRCPNY